MKKKLIGSVLLVVVLGFIFFVAACGNQEQPVPLYFGQENESTQRFELINNTSKDIQDVSIKNSGKEGSTKLEKSISDQMWVQGSVAVIFLQQFAESSVQTEVGDISVKTTYDITITFSDSSTAILHNIVSSSIKDFLDANLCFSSSDNIIYLEYKNQDDIVCSTLEAEKKIVADAKAATETQKTSSKSSNSYSQYSEGCTGGNIAIR